MATPTTHDTSPPRTRLHVVIPFYNGHSDLPRLLRSLHECTLRPSKVWIVDNSPDGQPPLPISHELTFPVQVLRLAPGVGFGRACNAGAMAASSEGATHICLLNQDGAATPRFFEYLVEDFEATNAVMIGPLQCTFATQHLSRFVARLYVPEALTAFGRLRPLEALPSTPRLEPRYLAGAALLFAPSMLEDHGLFDPLFTMYGEDRDLCDRLRVAGARMVLSRRTIYLHDHSNAHARGAARVRLLVWQSESRAIRRTRDHGPSAMASALESAVLFVRAAAHVGIAQAIRAVRTRNAALRTKHSALIRAHNGHSLLARMREADMDKA